MFKITLILKITCRMNLVEVRKTKSVYLRSGLYLQKKNRRKTLILIVLAFYTQACPTKYETLALLMTLRFY